MPIAYRSVLASNAIIAESLVITNLPNTTTYAQGDTLDTTGLVVTATVEGISGDVTARCTISPTVLNTSGTQTISALYGGKIATFDVTVEAITNIEITTPPTRLVYSPGDTLDLTGIVVTATTNSFTRDVTAKCTYNPEDGTTLTTEGSGTLTASYLTFSDTVSYKVVTLVSWSSGTDAQIKSMVDSYYAGDITLADIQQYWHIGDQRTVSLAAMAASYVSEAQAAQNVTMVIMNWGGKKLADGVTDCLAIVGQKNCLATTGYINSTATNAGGWNNCARRSWCNAIYYNAIPSTLRPIFKQHINYASGGSSSPATATASTDYFALPSEKEVFGYTQASNSYAETNNSQFAYYAAGGHTIKYLGDNGVAQFYWERSPYNGQSDRFGGVGNNGSVGGNKANVKTGIAPFGVI